MASWRGRLIHPLRLSLTAFIIIFSLSFIAIMTRHHSTCVIFRCWRATLLVVDWLSRVRMCLSSAAGQASSVSLLDTWGHMYASPIRRTLPRFLPLPGSPRHCTLSSSSISLCRRAEHTAHSSRSWSAISCSTICSQMSRLQNSTGACVASFPVRQITCRTWLQFYTLSHIKLSPGPSRFLNCNARI